MSPSFVDLDLWRSRLDGWTRRAQPAALLLARASVGGLFVSTGWGKVHHLAKVTQFFTDLGIVAPSFTAGLVAWSELVCGTLLLVGLLARLATIPLVVTMAVALLTAKRGDIQGPADLVAQSELTYLVVLLVVFALGPGAWSLDGALRRAALPRLAARAGAR